MGACTEADKEEWDRLGVQTNGEGVGWVCPVCIELELVLTVHEINVHGELWQRKSGLGQSCYRLAARAYAWCRGVGRQTRERGGVSWRAVAMRTGDVIGREVTA